MNVLSKITICSTALMAAALAIIPGGASAHDILETKVVSERQAAQVNIGTKKALGFYGKRDGKCALTVLVFENIDPTKANAGSFKTSPTRVRFNVAPGATARLDAAQGRTVAFMCGSGARRMTVMTHGPKTELPAS